MDPKKAQCLAPRTSLQLDPFPASRSSLPSPHHGLLHTGIPTHTSTVILHGDETWRDLEEGPKGTRKTFQKLNDSMFKSWGSWNVDSMFKNSRKIVVNQADTLGWVRYTHGLGKRRSSQGIRTGRSAGAIVFVHHAVVVGIKPPQLQKFGR